MRITAQLIEASSDRHLWARSYERDLKDVLALQGEVARDIAEEISIKLTPKERTLLTGARAVDPAAHDAYLRGRYWWSKRDAEGEWKGLDYFRRAVASRNHQAELRLGLVGGRKGVQGSHCPQSELRHRSPLVFGIRTIWSRWEGSTRR